MALRPKCSPNALLSDQHSGYGSAHEVGERAGEDSPDTLLGDFGPAVGRYATEATEQNRQRTQVCEAGEREGDDGGGLIRKVPDIRGKVRER